MQRLHPQRGHARAPRLCLGLVLGLLASCSSLPRWMPGSPDRVPATLSAERVPDAIERAEADLERNDSEHALEWMRVAAETKGLSAEVRDRVQVLLERAASERIAQLSRPGNDPRQLEKLVGLELPRQLAVRAGLQAARALVAENEPMEAFRVLKALETKFPLHHERQAAGDLLCEAGLTLIQDGPGFLGWLSTRDEGQEILEYVILDQPWARRCDEAYAALSRCYEEERDWGLAVERAEKLVLDHPGSPLRIAAQARIPHLRLRSLKSPEYDRVALQRARTELEEWLIAYAGHPLEPEVRVDLGDALRRLSDNDMIVSRFYRRVDNAFGARRHASRAIEEARDAGDPGRVREAESWLAGLPGAKDPITGAEYLPPAVNRP